MYRQADKFIPTDFDGQKRINKCILNKNMLGSHINKCRHTDRQINTDRRKNKYRWTDRNRQTGRNFNKLCNKCGHTDNN